MLRISADPNNLPFTNERREGFENRIAELIAKDLGATIEYHWRAQRRGFFRNALKENECDLVLGAPAGFERAALTAPYYRSTYVFVYRPGHGLDGLATLDDPRLREVKIGVQVVGDDGVNTPPVHALSSRGIVQNVRGYTLYGDYREANPPARILDAVSSGEIDVAIVWGPLAGYFANRQGAPLRVTPVSPEIDRTGLPFVFEITMGCRKGDRALRDEVNEILARRKPEIDRILDEYGVPRLALLPRPAHVKDDDDDQGKNDDHDPCCGDGPPK